MIDLAALFALFWALAYVYGLKRVFAVKGA